MLSSCLLAGLIGLALAQSNTQSNNWYSPSVGSSTISTSSSAASTSSSATSTSSSAASSSSSVASTSSSAAPMLTSSSTPSSTQITTINTRASTTSSSTSSSTASSSTAAPLRATAMVASFNNTNVKGSVVFEQANADSPTTMTYDFTGNGPLGQRGIHIHRDGNTNCTLAGPHFNPTNMNHGDINATVSHAGDLGNIPTDSQGNAKGSVTARFVTLSGPNSVLGRTFIIHGGRDDLGTGTGESLTTGNSGLRVACGIIMA